MSQEQCEMSLQQTRELLRLTDATLKDICCKRFTSEELYAEALGKVLGGKGRRGPRNIFIIFEDSELRVYRGRVYHLREGGMVEMSDEIAIDYASVYAIHLPDAESVVSNWGDTCETVEEYQANFDPRVKSFVQVPIKNFVCYRISGERPGAMIAINYPGEATEYDAYVLRSLAVVIGSLVTLSNEVRETEKAFIYTVEALARACEAAEEETGHHIVRVNRYAGALAANMGLNDEFVATLSYSAQMHDVGKIKIPAAILLKKGVLTPGEVELIRMHPVYGQQILGNSPRLQVAREVAIAHHENWDGSGYPYGLKGENIPLAGRIVKVADVYDALRSRRSYKQPMDHRQAMQVFREGDERVTPRAHFDPLLLETFFRVDRIFEKIYESMATETA